jgi:hypothetical protein
MSHLSESISLPVSEETAYAIVSDLAVLLRLSPYLSLKSLKQMTSGALATGSRYEATIEYYGKGLSEVKSIEVIELAPLKKIVYRLGPGAFKEIAFAIENDGKGIQLRQQCLFESDDPSLISAAQAELSAWLASIGEYLKLAGGMTFGKRIAKYLMDKVWLKLTLPERKIALILIAVSALELFLLILMVLAWNIYQRFDLVQRIFRG